MNTFSTTVARFKHETITFKLLIIGALFVATLIPLMMVSGLISERAERSRQVESDIADKWAREQTLYGAALSFPYMHTVYDEMAEGKRVNARLERRFVHVLPTTLEITSSIVPEIRSRGIFSSVVYTTKVTAKGAFDTTNLATSGTAPVGVFSTAPTLSVGVDDLGGIRELSDVTVNGLTYPLVSGMPTTDVFRSGVSAQMPRAVSGQYAFSYTMTLRGSGSLYVSPLAQKTDATLTSTYQNPSFVGSFLPDTRTVNAEGFTAQYTVLDVNRSIPHVFDGVFPVPTGVQQADLSTFGVTLRPEISSYDKVRRSVEYGSIFLLLIFLALFSTELFSTRKIHPIQYALVAAAITVFYVLILALSEHMVFDFAYGVSALATYALLIAYLRAFIEHRTTLYGIAALLGMAFIFFYVLLQLEDYAVLAGAIAIFGILACVMLYTRGVNWYELQRSAASE
jgi:inner membrane protein